MLISKKWDKRFLEMAQHIASWSLDPSTRVGAVITKGKRIISLGYNGYPQGVDHKGFSDRKVKYARTVHGEANAILFARGDLTDCTIYVWPLPPCASCMGLIIQSGIKRVVTVKPSDDLIARWGGSNTIAMEMATESGVFVSYFEEDKCR